MKIVIDTDADDLETSLEILKNAYDNIGNIQLDIMSPDKVIHALFGNINTVYKACISIAHNAGFIFAQENPMADVKFMTSAEFCDLGFNLDQRFGRNPFMQDVTIRKTIEACNSGGFEIGYRGVFIDLYGKRQWLYDKAKEDAARHIITKRKQI